MELDRRGSCDDVFDLLRDGHPNFSQNPNARDPTAHESKGQDHVPHFQELLKGVTKERVWP